jgi:hypothetical protein
MLRQGVNEDNLWSFVLAMINWPYTCIYTLLWNACSGQMALTKFDLENIDPNRRVSFRKRVCGRVGSPNPFRVGHW